MCGRSLSRSSRKFWSFFVVKYIFLIYLQPNGGLAHLARALAWQARGNRFDSGILHKTFKPYSNVRLFFVFLPNPMVGGVFGSAKIVFSTFYKSTPESRNFGTNWRSNLKSKVINLKSKSPSVSEGAFALILNAIYRLIILSDFTFSPWVTITLYTPAG